MRQQIAGPVEAVGASVDLALGAAALEGQSAEEILSWASRQFGPRLTFATGLGVEGCVLIDLVGRLKLPIDLFMLDTGVLFPETYALKQKLEQKYGLTLRSVHPTLTLEAQAGAHGERLWERDPDRCCRIRKVLPLRRALVGFEAWISAIRRDQTSNRADAPVLERDARTGLIKVNPLVRWTTRHVWDHVHRHQVPYNPLHDQGYPSIGCAPCTSAVAEGEDPRAGRWRGQAKTECGLHAKEPAPRPEEKKTRPAAAAPLQSLPLVSAPEAPAFFARARNLPRLTLAPSQLEDLERLALGLFGQARGFVGLDDYRSCLARQTLADGAPQARPLILPVSLEDVARLAGQPEVALHDGAGRLWATLTVREVFSRDLRAEARARFGTDALPDPRVAALLAAPATLLGGEVRVAPLPEQRPHADLRREPSWVQEQVEARGWKKVAFVQVAGLFSRVDEERVRRALELTDGVLVALPADGGQTPSAALALAAAREALTHYLPAARVLLLAVPGTTMAAGLEGAFAARAYGATHASGAPEPLAAAGLAPLELPALTFCPTCQSVTAPLGCPHPASPATPEGPLRPEVLALLRPAATEGPLLSLGRTAAALKAAADGALLPPKPGFILWFTGLSGAGKSTLAQAVRLKLAAAQPVEVLDGDEVRAHLSQDLGFSRQDRDQNVHRIAFLARALARHGVAAITAAISPYAQTREEVRALATAQGVPFVEVHAHAALEALVARDEKGLYRRALAGELSHFTGVDDPYEAPLAPDVLVRSDQESVEQGAERVLAALKAKGLLSSAAAGP